jgi:sortase A
MADETGGEPATPSAPGRHRQARPVSAGDTVRLVLRGVGQTLITFGLVVLLFVVYEVYVTNYFSHREQAKVHQALEKEWAKGKNPLLALPDGKLPALPTGQGIANLYIPRLGRDYAWTIVQGVSADDLSRGPGHYPQSALPGQIGDFAVAGHRVGKGEPFLNLDQLRPGDAVIVQTESMWYVYRVLGNVKTRNLGATGADGVPGREIVDPSDGQVVAPWPDHPNRKATKAWMTMTTCHPKFTATHRMIVHAVLAEKVRATGSAKPAAIVALYGGKG